MLYDGIMTARIMYRAIMTLRTMSRVSSLIVSQMYPDVYSELDDEDNGFPFTGWVYNNMHNADVHFEIWENLAKLVSTLLPTVKKIVAYSESLLGLARKRLNNTGLEEFNKLSTKEQIDAAIIIEATTRKFDIPDLKHMHPDRELQVGVFLRYINRALNSIWDLLPTKCNECMTGLLGMHVNPYAPNDDPKYAWLSPIIFSLYQKLTHTLVNMWPSMTQNELSFARHLNKLRYFYNGNM